MRDRSLECRREVSEPRHKGCSVLVGVFVRSTGTQVDFDVDEPTVEPSIAGERDEHVGVAEADRGEAVVPVGRDELDNVGLPGVPFEDQGPEDSGPAGMGRSDPTCRRASYATVRETAGSKIPPSDQTFLWAGRNLPETFPRCS